MTWFERPLLIFLRYYRSLGLRVSLYAVLSIAATMIGPLVDPYLHALTRTTLEFESVLPVLTILASSMLAVSTFSLSIMVTAHRAAAESTTPRVHRLLLDDTTTQSVLATFIGAFVYSLASIVLYQAGFYANDAALSVMAITIVVVVLVLLAMLRWIQHLSKLGSVDDNLRVVTDRARSALVSLARQPALGANPLSGDTILPQATRDVRAIRSGYLQLIDIAALNDHAPEHGAVYVLRAPGTHVLSDEVVARVSGAADAPTLGKLAGCFVFGDQRTYEQDATFGLCVLSEIAAKALSPGVNDAGTAIEAIQRLKTLLWNFAGTGQGDTAPTAPRVFVPVPDHRTLLDAAFAQAARDGAGLIEVALCLRQALSALAAAPDPAMQAASRRMADLALRHAEQAGLLDSELDQLRGIAVADGP